MPRRCTICIHPARATIGDGLVAGQSLRDIAGRYALSKSALDRHKASHVPTQFARDREDPEARLRAARQADQWHYKQLRWKARAVMRAIQGWDRIRSPEEWRQVCVEARKHHRSGRFVILWQLHQGLIDESGDHSPAATMLIDLAVISYYNALRIQGWLGDLALWIEHECFAQEAPQVKLRREYGAQVESLAVEDGSGAISPFI
jgi:hypothetical protein